ncbi:MAG: hypothetical protein Q8L30_02555 [bacterium]|nr:hypothetical protein [bacterium]
MTHNTMIENNERSERTNKSNIELVVMRRVRLIRVLGLVISTTVLATLTFTAALWGIGKEVWVARVFQNAPADLTHLPNFLIFAFVNTSFIVQVLVVLTLVSFVFLVREILRSLSSILFTPRA